jgi:hypothetical protein
MMLPRAQLMLRLGSMLKEFCAFGCGVIWTGRRRGFGPYYNTRPVQACWWSENEEGAIDTLYFKMLLPLYRVFQRWPQARQVTGWASKDDKMRRRGAHVDPDRLPAARRRPCGAVAEAKPFAYVAIAESEKAILETSGYDSFPYAVFRYDRCRATPIPRGRAARSSPTSWC